MTHDTFVLSRHLKSGVERVFSGWANPELKAKWFHGPVGRWKAIERRHDFVIDGQEFLKGEFDDKDTSTFDARYLDIVENELIVYCYRMYVNSDLISVSLATVQIEPEGTGSKMVFTEQALYYGDDYPLASRREGTEMLIANFVNTIEEEK